MGLAQLQQQHDSKFKWTYRQTGTAGCIHMYLFISSKAAGVAADRPCIAAFYQIFNINIEQGKKTTVTVCHYIQQFSLTLLKVTIKVPIR